MTNVCVNSALINQHTKSSDDEHFNEWLADYEVGIDQLDDLLWELLNDDKHIIVFNAAQWVIFNKLDSGIFTHSCTSTLLEYVTDLEDDHDLRFEFAEMLYKTFSLEHPIRNEFMFDLDVAITEYLKSSSSVREKYQDHLEEM